ncbi:MAG: RNA polymerase factor sigma-32 [Pseudomonadota bacterium]|nr:RNA polymerase factor sigma-32 [Pseudomonadota bacterium]
MVFFGQNISDALDRKFISKTMKAPLLRREEEVKLGTELRDKGDEKALDKLVSSHLRLVVKMAAGFKGYGLPVSDLIQEGTLGLIDAAKKFDPEKGVRFSTYARWWILASIQDYVMRNSSIVKIGTTPAQKSLFFNLRRLRSKISKNLAGPMSDEDRVEIAEILNVPTASVERMEALLSGYDSSLNTIIGSDDSDGSELQEFLKDDRPNPEENIAHHSNQTSRNNVIEKALAALDERERQIIKHRFLEEKKPTLEEIGNDFGVSKERIRQIEGRALEKLKLFLKKLPRTKGDRLEDLLHAH